MDAPVEWVLFIEAINRKKGEVANEVDVINTIDLYFSEYDLETRSRLLTFFVEASKAFDPENEFYCNELRAIYAPEIYSFFMPERVTCNEFYANLSIRFKAWDK